MQVDPQLTYGCLTCTDKDRMHLTKKTWQWCANEIMFFAAHTWCNYHMLTRDSARAPSERVSSSFFAAHTTLVILEQANVTSLRKGGEGRGGSFVSDRHHHLLLQTNPFFFSPTTPSPFFLFFFFFLPPRPGTS